MTDRPGETARALEAVIDLWLDPDAWARFAGELPVAALLDLKVARQHSMRLTVTAMSWRLDLDAPTLFGSQMTLVRHRDGRAEYHDHERGTRLEFPAEDVPLGRGVRPGQWHVRDPATTTDGIIEVVLDDPLTGERWIQRIHTGATCEDADLLHEFVNALLVGGFVEDTSQYPVAEVAALLAERGMPTEISLHADGSDAATSRIAITDYVLHDADPRREPSDYLNLRAPEGREAWSRKEDQDPHSAAILRRLPGDQQEDDPDEPDHPPPHHTVSTDKAQIGIRVEQRCLDDLQMLINALAAHLGDIHSNGHDLLIPWLEMSVQSSRRIDPLDATPTGPTLTRPGTFVPVLLHEDPGLPDIKRCVPEGGRGLVDRIARKLARCIVESGRIPAPVILALTTADLTAITTGVATQNPTARFASLSVAVRTRLIAAVAFEVVGTLRFSLSDLTKTQNFKDLYWFQLLDPKITVNLPAQTGGGTASLPIETPIVRGLRCRGAGTIEGTISLRGLHVNAGMIRTLSPTGWALLIAGAPAIAIFMPAFAWVIPILWSLTLFIATDVGRIQLDVQPLDASLSVRFAPRPASRALRPNVSVHLNGNLYAGTSSIVPTGINQLVDALLAELIVNLDETVSQLEKQIADGLQSLLDGVLGNGVPGSLLGLGVPVASGTALGTDDDYLFLEFDLDTPSNPALRITPVPVSGALPFDLDRDITRAFGPGGGGARGRHYLSFGASINAINQIVAVLWRRGEFNGSLLGTTASSLRPLLAAPFSGSVQRIEVSHAVPPILSFPPAGPSGPAHQFEVVFPSFGLLINRSSATHWLFRYRVTASGALGLGQVPAGLPFLSIAGFRPNVFEMMLDLTSVTATLIEAQEVEQVTITTEEPGEDPYHPQTIRTTTETVEQVTDRTGGAPAAWGAYGRGVFALINGGRAVARIPRLDGARSNGAASGWPPDASSQQTYGFDGLDPDDAPVTIGGATLAGFAHTPIDWGFFQGLAFAHLQASGAPEQLLSGTRPINLFTAADAVLMYSAVLDTLKLEDKIPCPGP